MYKVLYRKWRPQTFSDVVGQDYITAALKNEIKSGKLAHAYLFVGSRGTGKTSCAKILSKAVNCLAPRDGDPCNECEVCRGIDSGAIMDVVEIDAASNTGVDNIRDLRDEAAFTPAFAKYRVYIIDEVHMLTIGAFNALLKTLEEPPEHVVFILATTEIHKVPATILSRCQRFDFRRIPPDVIAGRLMRVADAEKIALDEDAALLIGRLSDGAMRDALSMLDSCAARGGQITEQVVSEDSGMTGRDSLFELADCAARGDTAGALTVINDLYAASRDMRGLCEELILHYRNLMLIKTAKDPRGLIACSQQEYERLCAQAENNPLDFIMNALSVLSLALDRVSKSTSRRAEMEMTMIRLCSPTAKVSADELLHRIERLEAALRSGFRPVSTAPKEEPVGPAATAPAQKPQSRADSALPSPVQDELPEPPVHDMPVPPSESAPVREEAVRPQGQTDDIPFDAWGEVLSSLAKINMAVYAVLRDSTAFVRGEFILINAPNPMFLSMVKERKYGGSIKEAIVSVTGKNYKIGIYKQAAPAVKKDPLDDFLASAQAGGVDITIK